MATSILGHPILLCAIIVCLFLLGNRYGNGISHIPGPMIPSLTGFWRVLDAGRGQAHETQLHLHRKYGPLVRIGPSHVSISDPKAIPIIYSFKDGFVKVKRSLLNRFV